MIKIGIVLNQDGRITSLYDAAEIGIYGKEKSDWTKIREVKECFRQRNTMNQMREFLDQMVMALDDCNILIASILTGIPFLILDKKGFMLCEAEELSEQLLEEIACDYIEKKNKMEQPVLKEYKTAPYETDEKGVFKIDMRKLQICHPEISSKKIIIPFLKETVFNRLLIYCSHVMPWLERELPTLGFRYTITKISEYEYCVEIG